VLERIGSCRIVEEIASGGMAVVYKAVQESLNRTVAIKALKTSVAAESQFATRFEREALSLAQLQHENIVHVYDFHRERGAFFIVMEFVDGIDLYDILDRCGRLPIDVAAICAMQVARALDYAHYRGIIHRDIKPANVMVSRSGGVKLMDFGIARDPSFGDLTETGTGLGTPSYMSPEQILGDKLDFRSDLFSLGIVLYQMVTGRKPFIEDEQKSVMHKIRLEKYPSPRKLNPEIPRELERIMDKCMRKVPRERWRSTQDLVLALERFLSRHVEMNYHARLVLFLKNQGLIGAAEADQFLHAGTVGGTPIAVPTGASRQLVRRVAEVQGGIAAAVALTVGLIHLAPVGADPAARAPAAAVAPKPHGFARVLVEPWAEVYVDGGTSPRIVTPGLPIELEAGKHSLRVRNPYFDEKTVELTVLPGDAARALDVRITLDARNSRPAPKLRLGEAKREAPTAIAEQKPVVRHTARATDTLELLAATYYADPQYAVFIMAANGILHPRPLRAGEVLNIPTVWTYRAQEGDTLAELARRYLDDERRAPFLAAFNHMGEGDALAPGQELTIPFHAVHTAQGSETLRDIALAYYGDGARADLLAAYNFRAGGAGGKPLKKGEKLIVPITDVRIRQEKLPPPDPQLVEREKKRKEIAAQADDAWPRALKAWKDGRYTEVRDALVGIDEDYLDAGNAGRIAYLLGCAYVALGEEQPALVQFKKVRERQPDFTVSADDTSPRIWSVLEQAGGEIIK
jgi:serine/threonine-protein kinase